VVAVMVASSIRLGIGCSPFGSDETVATSTDGSVVPDSEGVTPSDPGLDAPGDLTLVDGGVQTCVDFTQSDEGFGARWRA
jgi:hypothetical protein